MWSWGICDLVFSAPGLVLYHLKSPSTNIIILITSTTLMTTSHCLGTTVYYGCKMRVLLSLGVSIIKRRVRVSIDTIVLLRYATAHHSGALMERARLGPRSFRGPDKTTSSFTFAWLSVLWLSPSRSYACGDVGSPYRDWTKNGLKVRVRLV